MTELHERKKIRLRDYDYSSNGMYFITIGIKDKHGILWETPVGARIARPQLSDIGNIVASTIENIPRIYEHMQIEKYVIMPNHVHMILAIDWCDGRAMRAPTISRVICQMKGYVTKQIGYSIWQKLFYDRIIRDATEYQRIWQYIDDNPARWAEDEYYISVAERAGI